MNTIKRASIITFVIWCTIFIFKSLINITLKESELTLLIIIHSISTILSIFIVIKYLSFNKEDVGKFTKIFFNLLLVSFLLIMTISFIWSIYNYPFSGNLTVDYIAFCTISIVYALSFGGIFSIDYYNNNAGSADPERD